MVSSVSSPANAGGQVSAEDFRQVVRNAPLVSVDLIVKNDEGNFLLGLRVNSPARDFWFVPGGRVIKNETLAEALLRISMAELGKSFPWEENRFFGLYEHFYEDNVFSSDFRTHYVVAAFLLKVEKLKSFPCQQHIDYRWFSPEEILRDPKVHAYTKDYFLPSKGIR